MAFADERRPCAKCKTAGGVATCDGCYKSFCIKHFTEHREELSLEMDNVGQSHDLLRRDIFENTTEEHPILIRINVWEQEGIKKIQKAAQDARTTFQKLLEQSKNELKIVVDKLTAELQASRDSRDYTENEFKRWTEQINKLRKTFEQPLNIRLENDKYEETFSSLIKICDQPQPTPPPLVTVLEESTLVVKKPSSCSNETFNPYKAEAVLSENGRVATCRPKFSSPGAILYGLNSYPSGTHEISLRIVKKGFSRLFFGIYSSFKRRVEQISSGCENSIYGWWDLNSTVLNGTKQESSNEQIISTGDEIIMTLDCDNLYIHLYHVGKKRDVKLHIDPNKCPLPWKIIVKLTANGDCVRIL